MHDAVADQDRPLLRHGVELAGASRGLQGESVASTGSAAHNAAMLVAAQRFSAVATLVARVYGGYKWYGGTFDRLLPEPVRASTVLGR